MQSIERREVMIGSDITMTSDTKVKPKSKETSHRRSYQNSYGAMTITLSYLTQLEQVNLQGLNRWWYSVGVQRIQARISLRIPVYFLQSENPAKLYELDCKVSKQEVSCSSPCTSASSSGDLSPKFKT